MITYRVFLYISISFLLFTGVHAGSAWRGAVLETAPLIFSLAVVVALALGGIKKELSLIHERVLNYLGGGAVLMWGGEFYVVNFLSEKQALAYNLTYSISNVYLSFTLLAVLVSIILVKWIKRTKNLL